MYDVIIHLISIFAQFSNLNISIPDADIFKRLTFLFFHWILCDEKNIEEESIISIFSDILQA